MDTSQKEAETMYEVQRKTARDPEWKPLRQGTDQHPLRFTDQETAARTVDTLALFGGWIRLVDTTTGQVIRRSRSAAETDLMPR